jgi:hypothetical protein
MFGLDNAKLIFYGIILALILAMGLLIRHQFNVIDDLNGKLILANVSIASSKEVITKMSGGKVIDEKVVSFIDQGQSFVAGEHQEIADELKKTYEEFLLSSEKERICTTECTDFVPASRSCGIPKKQTPSITDEKMKSSFVDNAWKNYCVANRTAEGCK